MLMKYRSFPEFDGIRLFQDSINRMLTEEPASRPWSPAVDIFENENELTLKADLPEVKLEDIDIRLENGTLTLKGKREFEQKQDGQGYHRIERSYGSFVRAFSLPDSADPEKISADFHNGVLKVVVGKKDVAKPRTVKVNVQSH